MESNRKRNIRSGKEFDHLFPKPTGKNHRIKKSADVEDTIRLIRKTVRETLWHTEQIAQVLKGRTVRETCSNIWHFVYDHIQYERDEEGVEQIRSPRRTWWDRKGDCDCGTTLICSILCNLQIPVELRITKYPKKPSEVPYWQHIYPIVPVGDRYITLDFVKDAFDDEQPFLECKDYDMKLDYLDGIEDNNAVEQAQHEYALFGPEPDSVDLADLSSGYDDEQMGNIFKKVVDVHKNVIKKVAEGHKKVLKTVAKKGVHFVNRFTNPGTIMLRNGFLLATKLNLLNIGGRLRYAYLTDAQAKERGMDLNALAKVRKIKDKAEKIYYDVGGNKSNFKKAVLKGKGNKKHNPVPMNGLGGFDDNIYADVEEYNVLHGISGLGSLGDPATGASVASAMSIVGVVAGALKQVKGLFIKGGAEEKSFQSETDNAGTMEDVKTAIPDKDEVREDDSTDASSPDTTTNTTSFLTKAVTTLTPAINTARSVTSLLPTSTQTNNETTTTAEDTASNTVPDSTPARTTVPGSDATPGGTTTDLTTTTENTPAIQSAEKQGFIQKTTGWIKENPGKSLLIAGAIAGGTLMLIRSGGKKSNQQMNGLSGLPSQKKKRKHKSKPQSKNRNQKSKKQNRKKHTIKFTKLL